MDGFHDKARSDNSTIDFEALKKATQDQLTGGGLKAALSKIKDPENRVIEDTMTLLNDDQNLRRNAMNIAQDDEIKKQINNCTNSEKKKMLAVQANSRSSASRRGEIQGVVITIKGGMNIISYKDDILIRDAKYSKLLFKSEDDLNLVIFYKSTMSSGRNRVISDYTKMNIFGPVMVFSYDEIKEKLTTMPVKIIKMCLENFKTTRYPATFIKKIETPESD